MVPNLGGFALGREIIIFYMQPKRALKILFSKKKARRSWKFVSVRYNI